jgi:hypothetical protein
VPIGNVCKMVRISGARLLVLILGLANSFAPGQNSVAPESRRNAAPASAPSGGSSASPATSETLTQDQLKQLIQKVADNDIENDKKQRDYTYIEREVQTNLNGKGEAKSSEIKTYEVLEIYGEPVQRLIEKNDKPLSAKEVAKEDDKIQKIIDKRKDESDEQRKKRVEKEEKDREENRQFVREIDDAYNFKLMGTELVGGREAWLIAAEPRPGFVPHMKDAKYLPKFHGRVWIDKSDLQLAKMDVECLDTISWGLFLARFHKGSRVTLEQTRVNEEVWLPLHVTFNVEGRLGLVKGFNLEDEQSFKDYKKFRTDTKIVGMGEVQEK